MAKEGKGGGLRWQPMNGFVCEPVKTAAGFVLGTNIISTHTHAPWLSQVTQKERNALVTHLPHPLLRKTKADNFGFVFTLRYTQKHTKYLRPSCVSTQTLRHILCFAHKCSLTHANTSTPLPLTHTKEHPQINTYSSIHLLVSNKNKWKNAAGNSKNAKPPTWFTRYTF